MSRRPINISVSGLSEVLSQLDDAEIARDIGRITETYARKIANESAANAPVDTGRLKNSLASSPKKESETSWTIGSDLPYALRQEYEHRTKKGFTRKAVWDNRTPFREKIAERLSEGR